MGYPVTVFEKESEPGGMLRYAIPPYRLPDRVLKREIDWIKGLGIKIKTGKKIKDPATLLKEGFSAVLIAGGAPKSFPLGIEGEKSNGVIDALQFLKEINENRPRKITGNVVVIGGGSAAFDAARSAIRLGAEKVILAYRRGVKEMPADKEEVEAAREEGVKILTLAIPKKIIVKNSKVTGIEFLKAKLGKPDESGRRRPEPIKNSEFIQNAATIIPAIGAMPDVDSVGGVKVTTPKGLINVANYGKTIVKGVFAAGDVEMGPSSVVEAIGRGHQAANGINAYLRKKTVPKPEEAVDTIIIKPDSLVCSQAVCSPKKLVKDKFNTFDEVEGSLSDFEAVEEASRCFSCGSCHVCAVCFPNCPNKQLVATIGDHTFLVKVPSELSSYVTNKGSADLQIKTEGKVKSIKLNSLTSSIDKDLCIGCGRCEEVCSYRAIKNVINKDQGAFAEVEHDSCVSCSACVSECPTGAITQGYMTDNDILARLESKKTPYARIKALMSFWSTSSPEFGKYDGIVEVMSDRKPSPVFLIRALARSGRGLLVIKPDKTTGSHYLPWEEDPLEVVKKAWSLLKLVGISQDRIQYKTLPKGQNPSVLLKEFLKNLDKKGLKQMKIPIPDTINCPLGEAMAILRVVGANPDNKPSEEITTLPHVKKGEVAYFEGCLPMLHRIGEAHKLYDLSYTRESILSLLKYLKINAGLIRGFSCPSKGLLKIGKDEMEDIVAKISSNNLKSFKKSNPNKLILGTPEAYASFSKEKEFGNISALPEELLRVASKNKDFKPIKKTVALHKACKMEKDPFYNSTKELLKLIPGIKVVELKDKCGHDGFDNLDANSKHNAVNLMKEAVKKGAEYIVCTSPYCEAHLLLCQREGSWRLTDIEVGDVYQLLLASLEEGL